MAIAIAAAMLAAVGLLASFKAVDHALMAENLPKVTHGSGRTDVLEAELEAHHLDVPPGAADITYAVTSSWDLNRLAVRFVIPPDALDAFVASFGDEARLQPPQSSWELDLLGSPERYGWDLPSSDAGVGLHVQDPEGVALQHTVIVDVSGPNRVVHMESAW